MGDRQRIAVARDTLRDRLQSCSSLAALQDILGEAWLVLQDLPTRAGLAPAREEAITAVVQEALNSFDALETPAARWRGLRAFVTAWRQLDQTACAAAEPALAQVAAGAYRGVLVGCDSLVALRSALDEVRTLTRLRPAVRLAPADSAVLAATAVQRALDLPKDGDDDVDALLRACRALGAEALPDESEARLRLQVLLAKPRYSLEECVHALERIGAALTPSPLPKAAVQARTQLVADMQTWVLVAPEALPPLSPYQLPPLYTALSRLESALNVQLTVELEPPNTADDALLAARLEAGDLGDNDF